MQRNFIFYSLIRWHFPLIVGISFNKCITYMYSKYIHKMIKKFKFHTTCTLGFFWICYVFVCFNKLSINFKRYICIYKRKINYEAFEQATLH